MIPEAPHPIVADTIVESTDWILFGNIYAEEHTMSLFQTAVIGVSAMSMTAPATTPSEAQVSVIEQSIGKTLMLPNGAKPLSNYDRHYFIDPKQPDIIRAQFQQAKSDGNGRVILERDTKFYIFDGGKSIINLFYYGKENPKNKLIFGGR
ncbi:hypothetical protein NDN01_18045 [Sphingomonas sp. QA11]|uniref:hypothetical protein n=1 Tax=Sphingomonas sp. QA11 TaxID=2950605 RepID=UPI002349362C|nr:hypothetical protein [Sphingomonas sp. QA11]WCM25913.1 hypothetical protein NDN01_18045 [Sphingomonas sp. QA11]